MKRLIILACCLALVAGVGPAQAQQNNCSKAPAPRIKATGFAKVVQVPNKDFMGDLLKARPDEVSPVVRYLPVGTVVNVQEGPQCGADGNNYYKVALGNLTGYLAESYGRSYVLEPAAAAGPDPLPSTVATVLECIGLNPAMPLEASTPDTAATPPAEPALDQMVRRIIFGTLNGELMVSDNPVLPPRSVAKFNPLPLSVDLSPDGAAALVVTFNGLYWVDLGTGNLLLIADAQKMGLREGSWINSAKWLPDGRGAAVETVEVQNGVTSYAMWSVPIDGSFPPFRVDAGAQWLGGIQRSPSGSQMVVLSTNDISLFPKTASEDTKSLIVYVPRLSEGESSIPTLPTLSWTADEKGFYTYLPISAEAPDNDPWGGHIWYVGMDTKLLDYGKPPKLNPIDYAIVSNTGEYFVVGRGANWTIRRTKDGSVVETLPPIGILFGWTPDGKGIIYRSPQSDVGYLGVDGSTDSPMVPILKDMYDIKWMADGTALYAAQGKDKKLSLSVRQPGKDTNFLGIAASANTYHGRMLPKLPEKAIAPQPCGK